MPAEDLRRLTWQDATRRFLDAAEPDPPPAKLRDRIGQKMSDFFAAACHNNMTASETMRCLVGGGAGTLLNPTVDLAGLATR